MLSCLPQILLTIAEKGLVVAMQPLPPPAWQQHDWLVHCGMLHLLSTTATFMASQASYLHPLQIQFLVFAFGGLKEYKVSTTYLTLTSLTSALVAFAWHMLPQDPDRGLHTCPSFDQCMSLPSQVWCRAGISERHIMTLSSTRASTWCTLILWRTTSGKSAAQLTWEGESWVQSFPDGEHAIST